MIPCSLAACAHGVPWLHVIMGYLDTMCLWSTLTACAHGVPWLHVLMGYLDCMCSWGTLIACAHGVPWLNVLMGYLDCMCSWGALTACAHGVPWQKRHIKSFHWYLEYYDYRVCLELPTAVSFHSLPVSAHTAFVFCSCVFI